MVDTCRRLRFALIEATWFCSAPIVSKWKYYKEPRLVQLFHKFCYIHSSKKISMVDTALPQTVQELSDALVQIWEEIPQDAMNAQYGVTF